MEMMYRYLLFLFSYLFIYHKSYPYGNNDH